MGDFILLTILTQPAFEPVSTDDVFAQIRQDSTTFQDSLQYLEGIITAVREMAEGTLKRALITQQWELSLDNFPSGRIPITLPMPPLQTVDYVKYIDTTGTEQTLDPLGYKVIAETAPNCNPGCVMPLYGLNWPSTLQDVATVRIAFTCGYGPIGEDTALNVPKAICQWILLNCANYFENRESVGIAYRETKFDLTEALANGLIEKYRVVRL
jgi:uncharacterized phiE125 gp8 family phage protein